jgi:polysaccharide biosynthesis protein PslG
LGVKTGKRIARASAVVVAIGAAVAVGAIISSAMPGEARKGLTGTPTRPAPPALAVGAASHPWVVERHGVKQSFDALAKVHLRMLRIDALWAKVERSRGFHDWQHLDDVVSEADRRGVRLILAIHGTPGWANAGAGLNAPPDRIPDIASFCGDLAARYKGKHIVYEVWNEENANFGWGGPVQVRRYAALLDGCSSAIRPADPSGTVIVGGLARSKKPGVMPAVTFVKALYAAGARNSFDGIGFHPYAHGDATADGSAIVNDIPTLRELMVRNDDAQKQLWLTEFGYPVGIHHSPTQVAHFERRAIIHIARTYPYVAALIVYQLIDEGSGGFGLFHNDRKPRTAARMLANLVKKTDGGVLRP